MQANVATAPDEAPLPIAGRFFYQPGSGVVGTVGAPPTERLKPLDDYASKVVRARRRGLVYPYELQSMIAGDGGTVVEHDLDDSGVLAPVDRPFGLNKAGIIVAVVSSPTVRHPAGRHPGRPQRRPAALARLRRRGRVRPGHRGDRPRRADAGAPGVVLPLRRRAHLDGLRHREHGLGGPRPQAHHRVHPGGRRDQHRRRRHQRRRPALLERRGDDAHAHQGHPRHDARQRHGAHGQAVARLLRRRLGRGQLRHRRLRPRHGPERPGAVLGQGPRRRPRHPHGALRARLRRPRRVGPAPGQHERPRRPRRHACRRTRRRAPTSRRSARSSRARPTRTARSPSTSAP